MNTAELISQTRFEVGLIIAHCEATSDGLGTGWIDPELLSNVLSAYFSGWQKGCVPSGLAVEVVASALCQAAAADPANPAARRVFWEDLRARVAHLAVAAADELVWNAVADPAAALYAAGRDLFPSLELARLSGGRARIVPQRA